MSKEKHPSRTGSYQSIAEGRPLTEMQTRFVNEYIADSSSATKAALRAGYSPRCAQSASSLLLTDPRVVSLLAEVRKNAVESLGLSAERVLQELWKVAGANPGDVVTISDDGTIDLKAGGTGEVAVTNIDSNGKKARSVTTKTVKPADKVAALTQVAKIMNLFPEKEDKTVKVQVSLTELIERSMDDPVESEDPAIKYEANV